MYAHQVTRIYRSAWNLPICMKPTHMATTSHASHMAATSCAWNLLIWQRPHMHEIFSHGSDLICMKSSHIAGTPCASNILIRQGLMCMKSTYMAVTLHAWNLPMWQQLHIFKIYLYTCDLATNLVTYHDIYTRVVANRSCVSVKPSIGLTHELRYPD